MPAFDIRHGLYLSTAWWLGQRRYYDVDIGAVSFFNYKYAANIKHIPNQQLLPTTHNNTEFDIRDYMPGLVHVRMCMFKNSPIKGTAALARSA